MTLDPTAVGTQLTGRTAVVTGGAGPLGRVLCDALAAAGARVAINYRSGREPAEALAADVIAAGGDAFAVAADVSDEAAVDAMVDEAVARFGRLDILVCNSGLQQDARFAEAADELIRSTGKPILVATELAVADPDNPGPAAVRARGRLCYPSGNRAVTALGHLYRDARHRARRGR